MADQVEECYADNALLLKSAISVKEERQDENFVDDKVNISETAIIVGNVDLKDHSICDKMKRCNVSTSLDGVKSELSSTNVQYDRKPGTFKKEERINADNIKIEFNNRLLYCEDCQAYREDYCAQCKMLVHIMNNTVPINADNRLQEELPHNNILEIRDCFGQLRIFALKLIPAGVRFGPFTGINRTKRSWKIKGGKFVVNKNKSKYLNWMQYINPARHISEQNLQVFQYQHNLYYESTRQIEEGDELLVHFGGEYEDSLNRNIEMDFIPTRKRILKEAFACTFCCLGFSSRPYLAKHKTICLRNSAEMFAIEELTQCPSCKIHLDQKEYILHHMAYCCEKNDRKCILPTQGNRTTQVNGRKTRPCQTYKCQECNYRTMYKGDLKNHVNLHQEVKMYKCGICCRRFKTKEVLRQHVNNIHVFGDVKEYSEDFPGAYINGGTKPDHSSSQDETKQFKCSLCEFQTKYKVSLKRHVEEKHFKEFKYKCDTCDYKTNQECNLKIHTKTRHLREFKYKCDVCEYKTNLKSHLKMHIETRHLKKFKYKCDTCDYRANWKSYLKSHIKTKHLKEFKYKCDTCGYKTNCKSHLRIHIEARHLKEFKYKCDRCAYKANRISHLKAHVDARHSKEFKYKCDTCDYKANRKAQLKAHIGTRHLKEFKYKCEICGYKTNWKSCLKVHIDTRHLKAYKYKCDMCDYKTNQNSHLVCHKRRRHLQEFKYKCDLCDYRANWKSQLKTHTETRHLQEFKYRCDRCDYKAGQKSQLKSHVQTRHSNEFKYNCDTCDYRANQKCNLKKHIERRHLNISVRGGITKVSNRD